MNLTFPAECYRCNALLESVKLLDPEKKRYAIRFANGCGGLMSPVHKDDSAMVGDGKRIETDECRAAQRAKLRGRRLAELEHWRDVKLAIMEEAEERFEKGRAAEITQEAMEFLEIKVRNAQVEANKAQAEVDDFEEENDG